MPETAGTLYIVATPIGNLDDLSVRARRVLTAVDAVLCEDTRHTARLLNVIGARGRRISLHEHNEAARTPEVLAGLRSGRDYALVSDAGTPLVSDPGYRLVAAAREAGLSVSPVPGPCAAIAALSVAGLPSDRFCFEGFLPSRAGARARRLAALAKEPRTLVIYETGRRLAACLEACEEAFGGDRQASLSREMTKAFETSYRGTIAQLRAACREDADMIRGELVLIVAGSVGDEKPAADGELARILAILLEELPASRAARVAARLTGRSRKDAYETAVGLSQDAS